MTICWIDYLILDSLFSNKNKRYLTKNRKIDWPVDRTYIFTFKIYIKIFILATVVYDQNQLIFNQKPINQLAPLTGTLRPHDCSYMIYIYN